MRELLKQSGIYQIRNTVNGKIYVGSARRLSTRRNGHFSGLRSNTHPNKKLQNAWDKYGEHIFIFEPLITCAPSMLIHYEQQFIDQWKPAYNIRTVAESNAGLKYTPEQKEGLRKVKNGAAWKANMSRSKTGSTRPDDVKQRISVAMKIISANPEWRKNIAERATGTTRSIETKKRISANKKKYYETDSNRDAARKNGRERSDLFRYTSKEGITHTITEWAELSGLGQDTIRQRLKAGWDLDKIIATPTQKALIEFNGEHKLLTEWAKQFGIKDATLAQRLNKGWGMSKATTTPIRSAGRRN